MLELRIGDSSNSSSTLYPKSETPEFRAFAASVRNARSGRQLLSPVGSISASLLQLALETSLAAGSMIEDRNYEYFAPLPGLQRLGNELTPKLDFFEEMCVIIGKELISVLIFGPL
ncbi:hypothetical protein J6590_089918 [Homalodisca vitripennis]|nr:hypothetical protein J6590_089918 [Homalodisca vitripennis]